MGQRSLLSRIRLDNIIQRKANRLHRKSHRPKSGKK